MKKIAGVRFRDNWKVYDFEATGFDLAVGDKVIVDSERGQGLAVVIRLRMQAGAPEPEPVQMEQGLQIEQENAEGETTGNASRQENMTLRKILRKATADDLGREGKNREREREAFKIAQDVITERELPMKLIRVEFSFDASRAVFFFFSETRVDFRDLVKDLAFKLRTRIEMRQIGVRDVARIIGGFGPCGRELCCTAFLKNFEPVSIRMAKKQDMVLNPAKISGVCGRLLCCLSYEFGMYDEIKKDIAGMKEAAMQEKRQEEERRISEERKDAEERRMAEEKRRQAERKPQEKRERQKKEGGPKGGGQPEKKKEQQDKQPQQQKRQQQGQKQQKGHDQRPQRPEQQQRQQEQKEKPVDQEAKPQQPAVQQGQPSGQEPQATDAEKAAKKKRRRFWRKKKKGGGGGPAGEGAPPQGPGNA